MLSSEGIFFYGFHSFWVRLSAHLINYLSQIFHSFHKKFTFQVCGFFWILPRHFLCGSVFSHFISISSKYAIADSRPASIVSMFCWKRLGVTFNPIRRCLRAYKHQCVWMVRYLEHFSSRYVSDKSILENIFLPLSLGKKVICSGERIAMIF